MNYFLMNPCNIQVVRLNIEISRIIHVVPIYALYFEGVRRRDGEEYEPDTLTGVQNSIDRHLKDLQIHVDIKKGETFSHSRRVL